MAKKCPKNLDEIAKKTSNKNILDEIDKLWMKTKLYTCDMC